MIYFGGASEHARGRFGGCLLCAASCLFSLHKFFAHFANRGPSGGNEKVVKILRKDMYIAPGELTAQGPVQG